jgi:leader peptidase (prepilin peptidase)/N-methyltransferase
VPALVFCSAIAYLYRLLRGHDGVGLGDAKLLAAMGGWLGYQSIFPTIFLGAFSGSFVGLLFMLFTGQRSLQLKLPFGPFLVLGATTYLLAPSNWLAPFFI